MSVATPDRLVHDPELAVLKVLDTVLHQTNFALFAAHPELVSGDSLDYCTATTPQLWIADSIYNHASALQHAISRYREACEARRHTSFCYTQDEL